MRKSLVLIGMPGCGKSTLGVLLAKRLALGFVDTDLLIQEQAVMRLSEYQGTHGMAAFRDLESRVLMAVKDEGTVVATGGSAVYHPKAMAHLKALGHVVYLNVPLEQIRQRIGKLEDRGVVIAPGASLVDLVAEREPLYRQYADFELSCGSRPLSDLLDDLVRWWGA